MPDAVVAAAADDGDVAVAVRVGRWGQSSRRMRAVGNLDRVENGVRESAIAGGSHGLGVHGYG